MAYKVDLADHAGEKRIKTQIVKLLNQVHPIPRIDIVESLFTSNLVSDRVGKPGSKALRFRNLRIGDKFIMMPSPGDDHGHGGFKGGTFVFIKIKGAQDPLYRDGEKNNAKNLHGILSTFPRDCYVIRVIV